MLIVLLLSVVFLNSLFVFIFKGASESITETIFAWLDYMFAIRYFINNFKHLLFLLSGEIETNPGPKRPFNIKFCHQNLNGLAAHDFIKVTLVEAFITSNNFDLVCLSGTLLDSTIPNDDVNIQTNGYSLLRADHPNDIKRGGVCIYFKESLPLIRINELTNIKDCILTEISVNNEKCFFTCLYRSEKQIRKIKVMMNLNVFVPALISFFLISTTFIQPDQLFQVILMQNAKNGVLLTEVIHWVLNQITLQRHLVIIK